MKVNTLADTLLGDIRNVMMVYSSKAVVKYNISPNTKYVILTRQTVKS